MAFTMDDCLQTLRRRIGDTSTTPTFTDDALTGYIEDAVSEVELDYYRGFSAQYGVFNMTLAQSDVTLFCVKAHYLFELSTKSSADRNNFMMKKGTLTLDNTKQSKDHAETLLTLDKEYKRVLYRAKSGGMSISGVRME